MNLFSPRWHHVLPLTMIAMLAMHSTMNTRAQTSTALPNQASDEKSTREAESTVVLTPFEVQSSAEKSYGTLNSNSVTGFNVSLEKVPLSAGIFNSQFMEDTATRTVEELLRTHYAGAGFGSAVGDPSGVGETMPYDRGNPYASVQLRGLGATVTKQDGFMVPIPTGTSLTSSYTVERVELINGPQALLYGNGGAGGVINLISKQARLGQPAKGTFRFQIDNYNNKSGQFDYGIGTSRLALRTSFINQQMGSFRDFIGGSLRGYYGQGALALGQKTVIRLTGHYSDFNRYSPASPTLSAGSNAVDGRNGQALHYLLATNQIAASASGPSGAGPILNGKVNWENVDSFMGDQRSELTKLAVGQLTVDTVWSRRFSTQLAAGYQNKTNRYANPNLAFSAPVLASNPVPGKWSASITSGRAFVNEQPGRTKSARLSALATNDLFGGRARSRTMLGTDFAESNVANIAYGYYLADSNWNPLINRAIAANDGRTFMPTVGWDLSNGPVKHPLWPIGSSRVTLDGNNYVLMVYNQPNPARVSPGNPQGITLGGEYYLQTRIINRGVYAVNYTEWLGGKLTTMAGGRYVNADYRMHNQGGPQEGGSKNYSFMGGANYELNPWLRVYATVSSSYNPPVVVLNPNPVDPYGRMSPYSSSLGEEVGLKFGQDNGRISGYLAYYHVTSEDEQYQIQSNLTTIINPNGLNGRFGAPSNYISIDRQSRGAQAAITALPSKNWRLQLSAAYISGTIKNTTSYAQFYNDQFYQNSQGEVTYANGTVVHVPPAFNASSPTVPAGTPGATPLTVQMISSPANPYYADPAPVTGQINAASAAGRVLRVVDPVHGPILTGRTGLPISAMQINPGFTPPGTIFTSRAGDATTGYPQLSLNATSLYTIPSGPAKGLRIGGTAGLGWTRTNYYYYTAPFGLNVPRALFKFPTLVRFDGILGYERQIRNRTWNMQLNVNNLFNRYHVLVLPNPLNGYGSASNATFDQAPRTYLWTLTVGF